jgi:predicted nucleic acid-binding protein
MRASRSSGSSGSDEASELLENWRKHRRRLTAPALFAYGVTNALAKRVKRGQLTAKERFASLLENGPALENDVALNLRALEIMERFSLPSAYDAHYVALAESRQC